MEALPGWIATKDRRGDVLRICTENTGCSTHSDLRHLLLEQEHQILHPSLSPRKQHCSNRLSPPQSALLIFHLKELQVPQAITKLIKHI